MKHADGHTAMSHEEVEQLRAAAKRSSEPHAEQLVEAALAGARRNMTWGELKAAVTERRQRRTVPVSPALARRIADHSRVEENH